MNRRTILLACALIVLPALPSLAAETRPCADDKRIECIDYKPNEVVHIYAAPGETMRIQLGDGEKIAGLFVSDQRTIGNDPVAAPTPGEQVADSGSGGSGKMTHCDPNLCRSVVANFVYIMPRRDLTAQPFFLQMEWCNPVATCEPVPYAFELSTRLPGKPIPSKEVASANGKQAIADATVAADAPAPTSPYYGVRFLYPARDAAERKRVAAAKAAAWLAAHPRGVGAKPRLAAVAQVPLNDHYLYRGAASVKPDKVWDDGRSTFMRFSGLRRIPGVYTYLPDGTETNGFGYTAEPDETGTTLRIARTAARWCVRDGEKTVGCIFNEGPDPEGRYSPTVSGPADLRSASR